VGHHSLLVADSDCWALSSSAEEEEVVGRHKRAVVAVAVAVDAAAAAEAVAGCCCWREARPNHFPVPVPDLVLDGHRQVLRLATMRRCSWFYLLSFDGGNSSMMLGAI